MTTNSAELAVVLLGLVGVALWNWALPILVVQILAIDLLAEILPLTFLTFDPPSKAMMTSPPRSQNEHIITTCTGTEIIFLGVLIGALAFGNFGLYMFREGITLTVDTTDILPYVKATTIAYLTIAYCQFVNIMSRRYTYTSLFNRNFSSNKILIGPLYFPFV